MWQPQSVYYCMFLSFAFGGRFATLLIPWNHVPPHVWTDKSNSAATQDEGEDEADVCALCCHKQAPTAAACRSARFWELLVGVLKHAAACRSEPKFSHGGLFFFITCQICEPFVAQMPQI